MLDELSDWLERGTIVGYTSVLTWLPSDRRALDEMGVPLFTVGVDDQPGLIRHAVGAAVTWARLLPTVRFGEADAVELLVAGLAR